MGGFTHNFIPNGDLSLWDAGPVPRDMDAQVTATTITHLERRQIMEPDQFVFIENQNWADIRNRLDKFTYSGEDSMRVTLTAAAVADDFRIMPEGVVAARTGASTRHVPVDNMPHKWAFTVAARCNTDGNVLRMRLVLRDNTDTPRSEWDQANGLWQDINLVAVTVNDFQMTTRWRRYGLTTDEVPQVVNANAIENMIWQISNGTAGAQIIDLDDFQINDLEPSFSSY